MSTDRADEHLSIMARQDLLWIVARWPALVAKLTPGGGNAQNGMPSAASGEAFLPIDVNVSDVMREVEDEARHWAWVLLDEVPARHGCQGACGESKVPADRCPNVALAVSTSTMPELLTQVAWRYGHFVAEERMALEFMDTVTGLREKVRKVVEQRESPRWVGPCQTVECVGELYVGAGKDGGTCRVCGAAFTLLDQQAFIFGRYQERLMTPAEIGTAFKVLDIPRAEGTIRSWISRGRLVAVQEGLYSLADAKALAERGRVAA